MRSLFGVPIWGPYVGSLFGVPLGSHRCPIWGPIDALFGVPLGSLFGVPIWVPLGSLPAPSFLGSSRGVYGVFWAPFGILTPGSTPQLCPPALGLFHHPQHRPRGDGFLRALPRWDAALEHDGAVVAGALRAPQGPQEAPRPQVLRWGGWGGEWGGWGVVGRQ